MALSNWSTTTASNSTVGTNPWAEGQAPSTVNDAARERMADVRAFYEGIEWRDWGHTPVYSSASAFTISSSANLSNIYGVNRRFRMIDSAATSYGTVSTTTWVGNTQTVTCSMDSGTFTNPLTSVSVGFDIAHKPVHTDGISGLTANTITQTILTTPGDMLYASATATASRLAVGATATVLTGGATPNWTASPSATSFNATSGFFDNGKRISAQLYDSATVSAGTTAVSITSVIDTTKYIHYVIELLNLSPTAQGQLIGYASADGVTYDSAAHYVNAIVDHLSSGTTTNVDSNSNSAFVFTNTGGTAPATSSNGVSGVIDLFVVPGTPSTNSAMMDFRLTFTDGSNTHSIRGTTWWNQSSALSAIQIRFNGTTIASGRVVVWGSAI